VSDAPAPTGADVEVADDSTGTAVDAARWAELARLSVAAVGVAEPWTLTLRFVDPAAMAELNRDFMGADGPTDVLSFPIDGPEAVATGAAPAPRPSSSTSGAAGSAGAPPSMLGDLVVCPEVAAANAADHAGSTDDELALLVVHGVLHLVGFDHATEAERVGMQARERDLLDRFHGPLAGDPWAGGRP